jgi:peroxiredoxin
MKTKNYLIVLFVSITLLFSGCMLIDDALAAKKESTTVPTAVPAEESNPIAVEDQSIFNFPISLINGETVTLSDYQGKTIMLVFFSVHCGHCHNESSHLEAIYQDYKDQNFIIISAEVSGADTADLQNFADEYGITFPLGADEGAEFARYMEVTGVPHNLLIDADGNIASIMRGFSDEESLRSSIELQLGN